MWIEMKKQNKQKIIEPYINKHIDDFSIEFIKKNNEILGVALINWVDMVVYICIGKDIIDFITFDKNINYINYNKKLYNLDNFLKIWDKTTPADMIISEKNNLMYFLVEYLNNLGYSIISASEIDGGLDRTYLNRNISDNKVKTYENMIFLLLKTFNIRTSVYMGERSYLERPKTKIYEIETSQTELYYISGHGTRYYTEIDDINKNRLTFPDNMTFFIFTDTGVPLDDNMMFFINSGIKPYLDDLKELAFSKSNIDDKLDELEFKIYSTGLLNMEPLALTSVKFDLDIFLKMTGKELNLDIAKKFLHCNIITLVEYIVFTLCDIKKEELPLFEKDAELRLKSYIKTYYGINYETQLYEPLIRFLTQKTDSLSQDILKMNYFTWWKKLHGLRIRRYYMKSIPNFKISFYGDNPYGSPQGVIPGPFPDEWVNQSIHTTKNIVEVPGASMGREIYLNNVIDTFKLLKTYSSDNKYIFIFFICNSIELDKESINTINIHSSNINKLVVFEEDASIPRMRRMSLSHKEKYLKYKAKYLSLKKYANKL